MLKPILASLFSLSYLGYLLFGVPKLSVKFMEFDVALPVITQQVINASESIRAYTLFMGLPVMGYLVVIYLLSLRAKANDSKGMAGLAWLMVMMPLAALCWAVYAMSVVDLSM